MAVKVEKHLSCRLLYPNPVCLLTTEKNETAYERNIMTISWLTPLNSSDVFICCVNLKRHSWKLIKETYRFVLNIPTLGIFFFLLSSEIFFSFWALKELVLKIGGCHGDEVDKFNKLKIKTCAPGWGIKKTRRKKAGKINPFFTLWGTVHFIFYFSMVFFEMDGRSYLEFVWKIVWHICNVMY